jgi:hypothetical protein
MTPELRPSPDIQPSAAAKPSNSSNRKGGAMRVGIAADHGGFALKQKLAAWLHVGARGRRFRRGLLRP